MNETAIVKASCGIIKDTRTRSTLHVGEGGSVVFFQEGKSVSEKNNKKLKIVMLGHKNVPSREGGIEVVLKNWPQEW